MKSIFTILTILFLTNITTAQQEYSVSLDKGTLHIINVNNVDIESYQGSEIIFIGNDIQLKNNERSNGLKRLSKEIGQGLFVTQKENDIVLEQVNRKTPKGKLTIKVPENVAINFENRTPQEK